MELLVQRKTVLKLFDSVTLQSNMVTESKFGKTELSTKAIGTKENQQVTVSWDIQMEEFIKENGTEVKENLDGNHLTTAFITENFKGIKLVDMEVSITLQVMFI